VISVVIPTLNEARSLPPLLTALGNEATEHEIIVIDGGSDDGTAEIASASGATTLQAPPGRGAALRAGAQRARGEILFFLHADSTFPAGGLPRIEQTLSADPCVMGGNFRVVFDGETWFSRWLTHCYARVRRLGVYYGDSGIFVRRSAYDAVGGFRPIALMEDLDFVRRLERAGRTCCIEEPVLITSSRRFEDRRPAKIIYAWVKLHLLFWLGVSPDRLAEIYRMRTPRGEISRVLR
jgi:rSAM/selenodomain-associated transferase 2